MLQPTLTNKLIKYIAYATVILSLLIGLYVGISIEEYRELYPIRWVIALIVFGSGAYSALFLFAISEALSRLQEIEYNSERTYKSIEHINREWNDKASK